MTSQSPVINRMSAGSATSLSDFVSRSVIDSLEENSRLKAENERLRQQQFLSKAYVCKNHKNRFNDDKEMAFRAAINEMCVDTCARCREFFVSFIEPGKRELYLNGKFCQCWTCRVFKLHTFGFCNNCIAKHGDQRLSCDPLIPLHNDLEERKLRDINQPSPETAAKRTAEWLQGKSYCKADE